MKTSLFHGITALMLACTLVACQEPGLVTGKKIPSSCWAFGDSLAFSFMPENDTLGLTINVEMEDAYAYSNLYLRLHIRYPSGRDTLIRHTQTVVDPLGHWLVERKYGSYSVPFEGFASFPTPERGGYQLVLQQDMREDTLCGISKVRIYHGRE